MLIQFNKQVRGLDKLKDFVSKETDEFLIESLNGVPGSAIIAFRNYDRKGIREALANTLQIGMEELNYKVVNTRDGNLWVARPVPFSLSLDSCVHVDGRKGDSRGYKVPEEDLEQIGTKSVKGFIYFKKIPIYQEIPRVYVAGEISYENREESQEPSQLLNLLNSQGYESKVISTTKQLEMATERANAISEEIVLRALNKHQRCSGTIGFD